MLMPFGKYAGVDIVDIVNEDYGYAKWLLNQAWLHEDLREAIDDAVNNRPSRQELESALVSLTAEYEKLTKQIKGATNIGFTNDEIKKLVFLCHPDKHDNSELATMMTQKLLALRR